MKTTCTKRIRFTPSIYTLCGGQIALKSREMREHFVKRHPGLSLRHALRRYRAWLEDCL